MTSGLVTHLERFAGRIVEGWSKNIDGQSMPFHVAHLQNSATPEQTVYSTLGLSNFALASRRSGKVIRHELVMLTYFDESELGVPGVLQQVGLSAIESGEAYLRGDVIGPRGPLRSGSKMEALYISAPAYFPDEFAVCELETATVVFAWLIPIGANEAAYVRSHGWNAFEERLVEENPDLLDLQRPEMTVC